MESHEFTEIETPTLVASTPEGARDFVVPSRGHPGRFYALPQSPQLFKQLTMVGGIDRYYQIARCLRDEDLRADRQFEFTQLDLEMSFASGADVRAVISDAVAEAVCEITGGPRPSFAEMTWREAIDRYGTDKPDTRFGMELVDLTDVFAQTGFNAFAAPTVKGMRVPGGGGISRNAVDELTRQCQRWGAKGLVWMRVADGASPPDGAHPAAGGRLAVTSPVAKFMSEAEIDGVLAGLGAQPGDMCYLVADTWRRASAVLGLLRLELGRPPVSQVACEGEGVVAAGEGERVVAAGEGERAVAAGEGERAAIVGEGERAVAGLRLVWVVDFPLFEDVSAEGVPSPAHHPFTMPHPDDLAKVRALSEALAARGSAEAPADAGASGADGGSDAGSDAHGTHGGSIGTGGRGGDGGGDSRGGGGGYSDQELRDELMSVRSQAYDLVLNGWELGSGSVRIHRSDIQQQVLTLLGIDPGAAQQRFGFLLDAFGYGAPPHAGFAFGIDRLTALLCGEENIREVIAFPKSQSGADPLTNAPSQISPTHLDELGLALVAREGEFGHGAREGELGHVAREGEPGHGAGGVEVGHSAGGSEVGHGAPETKGEGEGQRP